MSEYKVYWLTGFPQIYSYMFRENYNLSFEVACTSYLKSKQTSTRKINNFVVNRDHN